jgi:phage minor structural protein
MDWKRKRSKNNAEVVDENMTPVIYKPRETDFTHNGLGRLTEAFKCEVTEEANGKYELELVYPANSRFAEYFENGYQIKAKPNDLEDYHIFEIKQTYKDTFLGTVTVYAQCRTYKLGNRVVQYVEVKSANGAKAMKAIEDGMDSPCDVKLFSDISANSNTVFEARNVLNCIAGEQGSLLQLWGGEIKREPFKLSLLARRGRDNVGTVRYGKDLNGLKIKFDWSSIVTKILPFADLQDGNDGKTKRIYGEPVISEYVNNYPDIYARHIQFTEDQGVTDKASLDRVAKNYFTSMNPGSDKPKVSMELEVEKLTDSEEAKEFSKVRNYSLFDTFKIYHKLYDIDIDTKVNGIIYDSLLEKTKKVIAGDIQVAFYKQQNYEFQEAIKTLTKKGYMSEFVDYVTDLINGVQGGSVLQYPKNHPHTTYYMDTDSTDTAKNVIAINNAGIGFSTTGWRGPFTNAWTIDGKLNADFIRTGKIRADIFETSFNAYGDQLKLSAGALQAVNNKKKIMELTKQGLEFWNGSNHVGTMGTKGNPFPQLAGSDGPVVTDGNAILLVGDDPKKIVGLSNKNNTGIAINGEQQFFLGRTFNFIGTDENKGKGTIICDRLIVNGKEITGNGSGGGDGGNPPAELTTDQEKNAWFVWQFFKGKGWKIEAIAGMLGNMQSESGIMPDIDELSGGGGYGLVQWTPKSKLVDWCNERGLDHRKIDSQCQRIQWEVENNVQWFPNAERPDLPNISFKEFTQLTDIKRAAEYFIAYYEHPAEVNQPIRGTQAQYWYDKLKDLKPGNSTGAQGLAHLETLYKQRLGNGQCYAVPAEYSGFLGGCGLGAGTNYPLSHVIGNTEAAADIGSSYDWAAVGWKVINNPSFKDLVTGAIINWRRGGNIGDFAVDGTYGHTGVIRGLTANGFQTYEQNIGLGQVVGKYERTWVGSSEVSSIVIPPK